MSDFNKVICPACAHQFVAVPENVQQEIKTLREQLAIREKEYQAALTHGDEWKRRCQSALRIWKDFYPLTALWKRHGDAADWFKEE